MKSFLKITAFLLLLNGMRAEAATYSLVNQVPISGEGGWDYVTCDSVARRLYISHHDQTQVMDIDALTLVATIPNTRGVHGIALAPTLGKGFISAGADNRVVVFDLKSNAVLGTVKTGENPDAILFDPGTQRVFVFNGKSLTVTIFDSTNDKPLTVLPLGGKPEFAMADGHGSVYVNLEDQNQLVKINSRVMGIDQRWPVAPCENPSSLAMDPAANRLFVGCRNKTMLVMDALSGKVVTTLPIGAQVDTTLFEPETKLIFNANGDGTVTIISEETPNSFHVIQNAQTQLGARTAALDEGTHRLFLPASKLGPLEPPSIDHPEPHHKVLPGTFSILILAPK